MPLAHHVMLRLSDSRVLAPDAGARRALAASVLRLARPFGLLAFRAADTHLHVLAMVDRPAAGSLSRRVTNSLRRRLDHPVPFSPPHIVPVADQRHLGHTFWYVLKQEQHHGTAADPTHDASNLPDLLGLRTLGVYTAGTVRDHLPRVRRAQLLEVLGCDLECAAFDWRHLTDAAAAAIGVADLAGHGRAVTAARCAAIHVARPHLSLKRLATLLGMGYSTVKRLGARAADPATQSAVRLQLSLRSNSRATK